MQGCHSVPEKRLWAPSFTHQQNRTFWPEGGAALLLRSIYPFRWPLAIIPGCSRHTEPVSLPQGDQGCLGLMGDQSGLSTEWPGL